MIIDAMIKFSDADWLLWMDDDTWINPSKCCIALDILLIHKILFQYYVCYVWVGFLSIPLESYLEDVPPDKVFVTANYRCLFTNIYFIRNDEAGRRLAYDWLAIAKSGYIQCHGFDQVSTGMYHFNGVEYAN